MAVVLTACVSARRHEHPPPQVPVGIPPAGDYRIDGLRPPLAKLGAPVLGVPDARIWSFSGTRGRWHAEHVVYDAHGRATDVLVVEGALIGAERAALDWNLVRADEGKPRERFTGKLALRARDRRRVDGVFTFDEIPGRRDEVVLERLEDPLAGE